MKKKIFSNKNVYIILGVVVSLLFIFLISSFTGLVTFHEGLGGHIYGVRLIHSEPTFNWAGVYGAAFGVGQTQDWEVTLGAGGMEENNIFFECLNPDGETVLFISTVPLYEIDMNSLVPATPQEVDQYSGLNAEYYDSATNTFTKTMSITVGGRQINNIPAVETMVGRNTDQGTFKAGILKDSNKNIIVAASVSDLLVRGFSDRFYNYQALVPMKQGKDTNYYLFLDPTIECPEGELDGGVLGYVQGVIRDTSGNRIPDVIVTVGRFSTVSDDVGFYNMSTDSGNSTIFTVKEGYQVYTNEVSITESNVTIHDIILEEIVLNENVDVGPEFERYPTDGDSFGEAPPVVEVPEVIEGQDYWIPFSKIKLEVREGEFVQQIIPVQSFRNQQMRLDFEINGSIKEIVSLDRDSIIVGPKDGSNVTLTIFGRADLGKYNGTIIVSGGFNEKIIVEIEIIDKDKIPIQALLLGTTMSDNNIFPGSPFNFRTDLTNLLSDREYPISLYYTIQNLDGTETIWQDTSNIFLRTSTSLVKVVEEMPKNLPPGEYVIRTTASYLNLVSTQSHIFRVTLPFYSYQLWGGIRVWHAILGLLSLGLLIFGVIFIRRRIESKKKYHLDVDYSELPKPGPRNVFVGKLSETDHKSYMNLENFKTHTIVAGSTGGGKSFSAQVIIEEMLKKDTAVIVFDPTAQWTGFLRKLTNKGLLSLYPNFGMSEKDAISFKGNIRQIDNALELIDIRNFAKPGEIQIFALHKLDPKDMDIFVANTVRQVFRANFDESDPLRICLVYDEVHRLLPKFGGSGEGFLQIERACREFRKWGIGVMLISQVLADFVGQIKANINTEVQMRTRDEGDLDRIKTKYGEMVLQSLVKASVGSGMVQNSAYNRGRPYFTTFRPIQHSVERLSDEEISQYNVYNEKIDQISYELEQLEELKQDVFDLKLELKLALDKVKSGNFNMVNIYIEGIEPRIKKFWEKLNQSPKKFEKKYVSAEDLKAENKKAQEERKKIEEQEKTETVVKEEKKDFSVLFKKDVSPDQIFNLANGMLVIKPSDLYAEIEAMKDSDFEKHFNSEKNDFADWIYNAVGDKQLASLLSESKSKEELLQFLDMRSKGEKLPEPKEEHTKYSDKKETSDNKENTKTDNTASDNQNENKSDDEASNNASSDNLKDKTEDISNNMTQGDSPEEKSSVSDNEYNEVTSSENKSDDESNIEDIHSEEVNNNIKNGNNDKDNGVVNNNNNNNNNNEDDDYNQRSENIPVEGNSSNSIDKISLDVLEKTSSEEQAFRLEDGYVIHSLNELRNVLNDIPDYIFESHVNSEKNDFANWTEHVFQESDLAEKMRSAHNRQEFLKVLSNE